MNGWLLDTNVLAELSKQGGARAVKQWAAARDEELLFISVLVLAEYDKGIENLPLNDARRSAITAGRDALEARFGDRVLPLDNAVVRAWGSISGRVKRMTGHPPPVIDTLFAATAIEHDLVLVTRNVRDVEASGARLFNPWK